MAASSPGCLGDAGRFVVLSRSLSRSFSLAISGLPPCCCLCEQQGCADQKVQPEYLWIRNRVTKNMPTPSRTEIASNVRTPILEPAGGIGGPFSWKITVATVRFDVESVKLCSTLTRW